MSLQEPVTLKKQPGRISSNPPRLECKQYISRLARVRTYELLVSARASNPLTRRDGFIGSVGA
jgi:hypothetical protein